MLPADRGSLTKEFPLSQIDETILAIRPGMTYDQVRELAHVQGRSSIPALLDNRFLLFGDDRVIYDRFLSLVNSETISSPRVRKIMYFGGLSQNLSPVLFAHIACRPQLGREWPLPQAVS